MAGTTHTLDDVQSLREEIAVLRAQIVWLKQRLFGPGKSETLDRAQLLLQLGELAKLAAAERPTATITYERPAGPAPKRTLPAESFAHLPVRETVEIVPAAVRAAPGLYEKIGEERTFEVDVIPPQLFKRAIVRPKFRHCLDRNRAPLLAPAPPRVVAGGFASAGLIAWALTAKYCDHLPLYRQEKMLARWGAPISRQNLCDWVGAATALLEPLVKRMKQDLLAGGYVVVDETPIRCNDPDLRDGKTTQGWLWALSRPAQAGLPGGDAVFEWRLSRRHEELARLLGDHYRGLLQSDGYEAYASYARTHTGVEWLGCWAHARRAFHDALTEAPARRFRAALDRRALSLRGTVALGRPAPARGAAPGTLRPHARPVAENGAAAPRPVPAALPAWPSLRLSPRPLGTAHRAPGARSHPTRHQRRRKRHPAEQTRREELALRRPPRRRRPRGRALLAHRLGPAPRSRPARLLEGRADPAASHDHQGRPRSALAWCVAAAVGGVALVAVSLHSSRS